MVGWSDIAEHSDVQYILEQLIITFACDSMPPRPNYCTLNFKIDANFLIHLKRADGGPAFGKRKSKRQRKKKPVFRLSLS